jgi:hypothetical protein
LYIHHWCIFIFIFHSLFIMLDILSNDLSWHNQRIYINMKNPFSNAPSIFCLINLSDIHPRIQWIIFDVCTDSKQNFIDKQVCTAVPRLKDLFRVNKTISRHSMYNVLLDRQPRDPWFESGCGVPIFCVCFPVHDFLIFKFTKFNSIT